MIMRFPVLALGLSILSLSAACDQKALTQFQNDFQNLIEDPLDTSPYPVVIGGDDANVFYATNLADIPFRIDGHRDSYIIPGLLGPSNVYEFQKNRPDLIRPLAPSATGFIQRLVTDGRFVAYVNVGWDGERITLDSVSVEDLSAGLLGATPKTVVDVSDNDAQFILPDLKIDAGRLAVILADTRTDITSVRIVDLFGGSADVEFEVGSNLVAADLSASRFAYAAYLDDGFVVVLRDIATGDAVVLPEGDIGAGPFVSDLYLTANSVVWSQYVSSDLRRVTRYDIPTEQTRVISEGVLGRLAGATDDFLLTEEFIDRSAEDKPAKYRIRRIDMNGATKQLAEFKAVGLAGQARVVGNRAIWVNPERKIVIAPFDNRDRTAFKPY
ncbi:MAG TPA: hypothetical protein P5081_04970 [Phycisphaerae bacterium]|mgnify:CR=1 FL=1|nr:hypothetical protein [Phycisphaerae bacterium]HRW52216.1 hypothetical protein [Phycisphaerae bacterium]